MTVTLIASTPAWNEPAELLERSARTVADVVDWHNVYAGGIRQLTGGRWKTQAAMREHGRARALEWARRRKRPVAGVWLLQLDADELLVHGERLRPLLERWPHRAFPLPLVQESGDTTLAPFKLFRAYGARIDVCSEYVRLWPRYERAGSSTLYNLAGYMLPPELPRDVLLDAWPFLFHVPSARGPTIRAGARLSLEELGVETRPKDAIQWPLPPLTLSEGGDVKHDDDGTPREYETGDGDYACPGCGARYDTPGVCTGHGESPHEPIAVEAVKGAEKNAGNAPTKKELLAEAAELGIEGFGSKSPNDAIAAAIAEHKAAAAAA